MGDDEERLNLLNEEEEGSNSQRRGRINPGNLNANTSRERERDREIERVCVVDSLFLKLEGYN